MLTTIIQVLIGLYSHSGSVLRSQLFFQQTFRVVFKTPAEDKKESTENKEAKSVLILVLKQQI